MSFIEAMKSNWNKLYALNVRHKTFGERNEEREHKKHTNISSTDLGQGLCYYFFIVEVKEGRTSPGTK